MDNAKTWAQVRTGVFVKGTRERFSLNWYGAVIHGCKVVTGKNGDFISFPSFKGKSGDFIPTAYVYAPKGSEADEVLNDCLGFIV